MNKSVELKNVSKTFMIRGNRKDTLRSLFSGLFNQGKSDRLQVLKNVTADIYQGDFVGIIGQNGSGKSTLLKMLAGIYAPDKGSSIKVHGRIVPFLELGVGFNPELSGRENVFLNGTILGMTKKYLDEKYDEIVEFAELKEFMNMPVKNYSSGMMVRLAFSIAIKSDAEIFILDEVFAVGDVEFQRKSVDVVTEFGKQGKTIIFVSHDLEEIETYCNKAMWINNGTLEFYGDSTEAVKRYIDYLEQEEHIVVRKKSVKDD